MLSIVNIFIDNPSNSFAYINPITMPIDTATETTAEERISVIEKKKRRKKATEKSQELLGYRNYQ
jgi:hypothetical protein